MNPRPPFGMLKRSRLLRPLDSQAACVALSGPMGSGKTATLAAWAETRPDSRWSAGACALIPDLSEGFIVVDDADVLGHDAWAGLEQALRRHPRLRLRIAVRSTDVIPPHWDYVRVDELSFDSTETAQYLHASGSIAEPRLTHHLTGGLPSAVRDVVRAGAVTEEQIKAVLATAAVPEGLQANELLAVPHHLTERVVAELGGPDDFLQRAEAQGWGTWTGDPAGRMFVLNAPLRRSVLARMPPRPERDRRVHTGLASLLLDDGLSFAAHVEACAGGDVELADAALKQGGMPLLAVHGYAVNRDLARLPRSKTIAYPVILLARALCLNAHRATRLRAAELFGVAVLGARAHPRHTSDRALMRVVESTGSRLMGLNDGSLRAARKAADMLAEISEQERASLRHLLPDLHAHTAISLLYGGDLRAAAREFELGLSGEIRPSVRLLSLGGLAVVDVLAGDLQAADQWVDLASARPWPEDLLDGYVGSLLRIARAWLALERGLFEDAERELSPPWQIIDTIEHWPLMVGVRAMIDIGTGGAVAGLEAFRRIRTHRSPRHHAGGWVKRHLDDAESQLMLAAGDMLGARSMVQHADHAPAGRLFAARVAVLDGQDENALRLLGQATASTPRERMIQAVLEAVVLRRLGRPEEARAKASVAGVLHHTYGISTPLLLVPGDGRELFGELVAGVPELPEPRVLAPRLTPRERVVLAELVHTDSLEETALRLHVSVNTVKSQRRSLYRKLQVGSREDALATALAHDLLG